MSDAADDLERRARRYVEDVVTLADVDFEVDDGTTARATFPLSGAD